VAANTKKREGKHPDDREKEDDGAEPQHKTGEGELRQEDGDKADEGSKGNESKVGEGEPKSRKAEGEEKDSDDEKEKSNRGGKSKKNKNSKQVEKTFLDRSRMNPVKDCTDLLDNICKESDLVETVPAELLSSRGELVNSLLRWTNVQRSMRMSDFDTIISTDAPGVSVEIRDNFPQLFKIFEVEREGEIYVNLLEDYFLDFTTLADLLEKLIDLEERIYKDNLFIINEPSTVRFEDTMVGDPEALGIPVSGLNSLNLRGEETRKRLQYALKKRPAKNSIEKKHLVNVQAIMHPVCKLIRPMIEEHIFEGNRRNLGMDRFLQNFLSVCYKGDLNPYDFKTVFGELKYRLPIEHNFNIDDFLRGSINEFFARFKIISEISSPVIPLAQIQTLILMSLMNMRGNTVTELTSVITMHQDRERDEEITGLFLSYLNMGYANVEIVFEEKEDGYPMINFLGAYAAKLLLSYDDEHCFSNVDKDSVRRIHSAIHTFLVHYGELTVQPVGHDDPLNYAQRDDEGGVREVYSQDRRRKTGAIIRNADVVRRLWMSGESDNATRPVPYEDPIYLEKYPHVFRRRLLGHQIRDFNFGTFRTNLGCSFSGAKLVNGCKELVSNCENINRNERKSLLSVMTYMAKKSEGLIFRMNEYLQKHYYCGFRPSDSAMREFYMMSPDKRDPPTVTIRAKSLIYLLFSFDYQAPMKALYDPLDRFKLEVDAFSSMCNLSRVHTAYNFWIARLGLSDEYRPNAIRRASIKRMRPSYLQSYLEKMTYGRADEAVVRKELFLYSVVPHRQNLEYRCTSLIRKYIAEHFTQFGICEQFAYRRVPPFPHASEFISLAKEHGLWTNSIAGIPITDGKVIHDLIRLHKSREFISYKVRIETSDESSLVRFWLPYTIDLTTAFKTESFPIDIVKTDEGDTTYYVSRDVRVQKRTFIRTYIVDQIEAMYSDDFAKNYKSGGQTMLPYPKDVIWKFNEWNPESFLVSSYTIRKGVAIVNYFELISKK